MIKYFFSFLLVLSFATSLHALDVVEAAQQETAPSNDPIQLKLISDVEKITPSARFMVAISVSLEEGWKTYWKNPGEAGSPITLTWKLPSGFQSYDLEWPVPERDHYQGLVSFGYKKPYLLISEIQAPADLPSSGEIPIEVTINWVACSKEECVPGETTLSKTFTVGKTTDRDGSVIDGARDALPAKLEGASLEADDEGLMIVFPQSVFPYSVDEVHFFPFAKGTVDLHQEESLTASEGNYYLFIKPGKEPFQPVVEGIVKLVSRTPDIKKSFLVSLPLEAENLNVAQIPFEGGESLPLMLLFSVLGGILLNVMPCVLPIISLKIMSFIKLAQQSRRLVFAHGIAFSLGVILSFLFLGALLFFLRSSGMEIGWGFQLQDPTFVAMLAALIFIMSLIFFGIFEVGLSFVSKAGQIEQDVKKKNPSLVGSFASGVLATALSTPCSGPFLGTALGLSLTLPAHLGMLIFLAMGIGMALPYLLLSWEPKWLKYLPKPGPWMETFKQVMGFFLLLTVVWLTWVFLVQADSREILEFLLAFFVISVGAWILGKYGSLIRSNLTRIVGRIAALLLFVLAAFMLFDAGRETAVFHPGEKVCTIIEGGWETFSSKRVEELRAEGVPIFIDFTAKWCLLCQANFLVLEGKEVVEAFEKEGVVKMDADWTRTDPEITQALAAFGRNSVPLYVYYPKGKGSVPKILPQVLTTSNILEAMGK